MKATLGNKCELFANNYMDLSKRYRWNYAVNNRLGALLYAMDNRRADVEAIDRCRKIIKENTGIFSQFKEETNFMSSVKLALHSEPEAMFKGALSVYNELKSEGFRSSPYLVLAAISIALQGDPYNYQQLVASTRQFYNAMKEEHRFVTSADDYGFAALLAMSGIPVEQAVREMERCYEILKQDFHNSNAVQALSHVLTLNPNNVYAKCRRVVDLQLALKRRKCKTGTGIELSFLGILASIPFDTNSLADEVEEVNNYLEGRKGFGSWSVAAKERIMFSIALVCDDYMEDSKHSTMEMSLANNVTGILLAQQMAVMAAATGSMAAASSANS